MSPRPAASTRSVAIALPWTREVVSQNFSHKSDLKHSETFQAWSHFTPEGFKLVIVSECICVYQMCFFFLCLTNIVRQMTSCAREHVRNAPCQWMLKINYNDCIPVDSSNIVCACVWERERLLPNGLRAGMHDDLSVRGRHRPLVAEMFVPHSKLVTIRAFTTTTKCADGRDLWAPK